MAKKFLRPPSLYPTFGYSHAVTVEGPGRLVFLSGQVPFDMQNRVVGEGNFDAQATAVFDNLGRALEEAGACFGDVVKMVYYVVGFEESLRARLAAVRDRYLSVDHPPASVLLGVAALAVPGIHIEIEATAFVEHHPSACCRTASGKDMGEAE